MTLQEQPLWQQWKGKKNPKLPFNTKKPAAEPGSGRGGPALTGWGVSGGKQNKVVLWKRHRDGSSKGIDFKVSELHVRNTHQYPQRLHC